MELIPVFKIPILIENYPGDVSALKQKIMPKLRQIFDQVENLERNHENMTVGGITTYALYNQLHLDQDFELIVKFIEQQAVEYHYQIGYMKNLQPKISMLWANRYKFNSSVNYHNHAPVPYIAVLILEEDTGSFVLENPLSVILKHQPYDSRPNPDQINTEYFNFEKEIPASSGQLIICPGYLNHKTRPNRSETQRISLVAHFDLVNNI
jgi:quinol monooxygenase YgiN